VTRPGYRLLPHTADLLVEARADDFPSLCAISVEALFSLLTDRRKVRSALRRTLEFAPAPQEELLLSVLRGSLLLFSLDRFLVRDADATMTNEGFVVALEGEPMDAARHSMGRELKAVTAHALAVKSGPSGFKARFVVDV
jgi:SHS2 domain-containing protein